MDCETIMCRAFSSMEQNYNGFNASKRTQFDLSFVVLSGNACSNT